MIDLKDMTQEELEDLRVRIDRRMVELEKEKRVAALNAMREIAKDHGVSLEEMVKLASGSVSMSTSSLPAKYRDPENPANTWTGRGRKPKWLVAALENGDDLKKFEI